MTNLFVAFLAISLYLSCTVLLLIGIGGAWDVLAGFLANRPSFNASALFLPVSVLLFLGIPGARAIASVVFGLCYLILALLLILPLTASLSVTLRFFGSESGIEGSYSMLFVVVAMFAAVLLLLHWMLYSPPFDEHLG